MFLSTTRAQTRNGSFNPFFLFTRRRKCQMKKSLQSGRCVSPAEWKMYRKIFAPSAIVRAPECEMSWAACVHTFLRRACHRPACSHHSSGKLYYLAKSCLNIFLCKLLQCGICTLVALSSPQNCPFSTRNLTELLLKFTRRVFDLLRVRHAASVFPGRGERIPATKEEKWRFKYLCAGKWRSQQKNFILRGKRNWKTPT